MLGDAAERGFGESVIKAGYGALAFVISDALHCLPDLDSLRQLIEVPFCIMTLLWEIIELDLTALSNYLRMTVILVMRMSLGFGMMSTNIFTSGKRQVWAAAGGPQHVPLRRRPTGD